MSNRDDIMSDELFWSQLEYDASNWLTSASDSNLRQFWIDGFVPEVMRNTKRGADIEGIVWVAVGSRTQNQYRFSASAPQKLLQMRRRMCDIESLTLNENQKTVEIVVTCMDHES